MVFAEFNPYERYPYITRGYSPIQAIAMTIRGEKEIEDWNYSLLTNDVPPGMVLTTDQPLTEEQVKAIKSNWEANHT
jgi:phage portal protein BeeE